MNFPLLSIKAKLPPTPGIIAKASPALVLINGTLNIEAVAARIRSLFSEEALIAFSKLVWKLSFGEALKLPKRSFQKSRTAVLSSKTLKSDITFCRVLFFSLTSVQ